MPSPSPPPSPPTAFASGTTNGGLSVGTRSKAVSWYTPTLPPSSIPQPVSALLEAYSHVAPEEIPGHILAVREKAWQIYPYPCIGRFRFLNLSLSLSPAYAEILARLSSPSSPAAAPAPAGKGENEGEGEKLSERKEGGTHPELFLDLGCFLGQDIRKLIFDGARAERLVGVDLHGEFLELGYDLFRDRPTTTNPASSAVPASGDAGHARFIAADIFSSDLDSLKGACTIIHTASFLHLFNLPTQKRICAILIELLHPTAEDAMVVGRQVGHVSPGYARGDEEGKGMWRHDVRSFREMWEEVGRETGTEWVVEGGLDAMEGFGGKGEAWMGEAPQEEKDGEGKLKWNDERKWRDEGVGRLWFVVRRSKGVKT